MADAGYWAIFWAWWYLYFGFWITWGAKVLGRKHRQTREEQLRG